MTTADSNKRGAMIDGLPCERIPAVAPDGSIDTPALWFVRMGRALRQWFADRRTTQPRSIGPISTAISAITPWIVGVSGTPFQASS